MVELSLFFVSGEIFEFPFKYCLTLELSYNLALVLKKKYNNILKILKKFIVYVYQESAHMFSVVITW